ncbi:HK97 gp10 family phage protein [Streptomyces sp. V4-01]|uniref:HK97 gp10 family phage protein n=1 Tax=Actinacidiphila polyblastidii TaxID=3110430 RepID=A0ABU7P5B1_9ACTN|nr:HK97 gp10 family phage protein [Streptomyces sp. V4-01]
MSLINIEIDEAAIAALAAAPSVKRDMRARGRRVVQAAQTTAPVDTGEYRDSIHLEDGDEDGEVLVVASADHSIYVEHGTRQPGHPAHHTLTNALDAAGGDT